jgi:hypothetical protein
MRIKITGYLELEDDQIDENSPTGLTSEAYDAITADIGSGPTYKIADLEDIETEIAED